MGTVANVRVNLNVPFPALVQGGSGITITKQNGVWIVGQSVTALISALNAQSIVPCFAGSGLLNFGAFPGTTDATLVITGQVTILSGSTVEAFLMPANTVDHSIDEHWADGPIVMAGNIVAGVGFTIYGNARNPDFAFGNWNVGWRWQ